MAIENISRDIAIAYPSGEKHPIKTQFVQVTKNGKYVLNYLEKRRNDYVPSFTEIIEVNGEWSKSPFHYKYDEYEFLDYDIELSKKIINELPEIMKIRIKIADDRKEPQNIMMTNFNFNDHGAKEIIDVSNKDIFYVLFPNDGDDKINLDNFYPFGLPFPTFSYSGKNFHLDSMQNGENSEEVLFSKIGLSLDDRNKITRYLKAINGSVSIKDIPELDVINSWTNEKEKIHFVNCSDLDMFGELYKTKNIYIKSDGIEYLNMSELLSKAFSNDIKMSYDLETGEKKNNGVNNNSIKK